MSLPVGCSTLPRTCIKAAIDIAGMHKGSFPMGSFAHKSVMLVVVTYTVSDSFWASVSNIVDESSLGLAC